MTKLVCFDCSGKKVLQLILGGEALILVKCLFHDEQGFYFLDTDECGWICNWCGTINPLDASSCERCGESYGSSPPKKR